MSKQYPGGIISKTPPVPSGPYENNTASGVWTLEQQAAYAKQGNWPTQGNVPSYIEDVFSTYLYNGNSGNQTITNGINVSGNGGLVWIKARTNNTEHWLIQSVNTGWQLASNSTHEAYNNSAVTLASTGFSLVNNSNVNASGQTYVSWAFQEKTKFFDMVTWTGDGTDGRTIAHNLGSVPGCMIVKRTNSASEWAVYHRSLGATKYMWLNDTTSADTSAGYWNNTEPTSSVFTVGSGGRTNGAGNTYVGYFFAHDAGGFGLAGTDNVISCGTFSVLDQGPPTTVTLGYEPQWVMVKRTNGTGNWIIFDTMRGWEVVSAATDADDEALWANLADAANPDSGGGFPTATGFVYPQAGAGDATYIYIAIRRGPMKIPTVGTSVFSPLAISNSVNTKNTTNFPIDMQWWRYRTIENANVIDSDRLRSISTTSTSSGQFLRTTSTFPESTGSNTRGWDNTGFLTPVAYADTSTVLWNWRRAPGYFDTVCYTGTGVAGRTINHNLTVAPELVIVKKRSDTESWGTLYVATSSTSALNSTAAFSTSNNQYYFGNDTIYVAPTSSVFTVGSVDRVNTSSGTYVAYLFATCAGVSKVGSYTGTGALQTVNCGFTTGARFVLIKRADSTGGWYVWDSARGITAGNDPYLLINTDAGSEVTGTNYVDTDTTGFKVTAAAPAEINASGGTFIFLAIA